MLFSVNFKKIRMLDKNEIRKKVSETRNKDLLILYALIPLKDDKDLFQRYEFIQKFLKESKQFKVKRKVSEEFACDIALRTLAINSKYKDPIRFALNMENKLIENIKIYLEEYTIDEIKVKIVIDECGKAFIACSKDGKELNSVPGKYKKEEYIIELKRIVKKLKDQYNRIKKIIEKAIEEKTELYFKEIKDLINTPVANPILKNLVFIKIKNTNTKENSRDVLGFFIDNGIVDFKGRIYPLCNEDKIRIANIFDLCKSEVI